MWYPRKISPTFFIGLFANKFKTNGTIQAKKSNQKMKKIIVLFYFLLSVAARTKRIKWNNTHHIIKYYVFLISEIFLNKICPSTA